MPKMKSHGGISKKIQVRNSGSTKIEISIEKQERVLYLVAEMLKDTKD